MGVLALFALRDMSEAVERHRFEMDDDEDD
jgi:hypothetical protein